MALLLAYLVSMGAFAQDPAPEPVPSYSYTDTNSVQARRSLEKISRKNPAQLSEAELAEWVRARFAWIALMRLEGKEKEARKIFAGCGSYCEKQGPEKEWLALKAWGCARDKAPQPCKTEKTKAQKPPH